MQRILLVAFVGFVLLAPSLAAVPFRPRDGERATSAMPRVVMETSHGRIVIELYAEKAPITVKNFLQYVDAGHYDGMIFHRVIADFMIQGGGFTPGMNEKATRDPIKNEAENGLINERGTIAAARASAPDSATAQFFINTKDNKFLDRANSADKVGYCVFGKVVEGMDVVDQIRKVATGQRNGHVDVPTQDVVINSVRVLTK
jgi:cyclophilin family peptidyl-prolyl cis-trans isomerase